MQLRKMASTAIGALLAGATFAVPALATLDDLPAPFVMDGEADFTIVVGDGASTADVIGAVDIAARFGGETVETETASAGEGEEDVNLGEDLEDEFTATLDDDDVAVLIDTTINFDTETWDVHDEIKLGTTSPAIETSLTSNEEDYKADAVLEIAAKGDIGYYYIFDEQINLSARVDSDTELEIDFMGRELTITEITDADTLVAQVGEKLDLNAGESATVEGKTVTLVKTSDDTAQIEVDGVTDSIDEGESKTVNGLEVKVDTIFNDEGTVDDSVILIVGEDAEKSFDDNDEYIDFCTTGGDEDCDEDNPDWVWDIGNLRTLGKGDTNPASGGPTIGVINDFVQDAPSKDPALVGESVWLPHDFAAITMNELLVDDFVKLTVEFDDAIDLDDADILGIAFGTSEDGFTIVADTDETLVLRNSATGWNSEVLSADVSTERLALILNDTTDTANPLIQVFYWDEDNDPVFAGNITANGTSVREFGMVDYKDTTGVGRVAMSINQSVGFTSADDVWLMFADNDSEVDDEATDDLFIRLGTTGAVGGGGSHKFDALGVTSDDAEAADVVYGRSSNTTAANTVTIGTREEDQLTAYGIKVGDLESNGDNDRVTLWVPGDRQEVRVAIGKDVASASGDRSGQITTPVGKLDTEISSPASANNLILVGGPCANTLVAQLADDDKYPWTCDEAVALGPGEGYTIELIEDAFADGQVALVVAGLNKADTRDAAARVQTFDTDGLTGSSVRTGVFA